MDSDKKLKSKDEEFEFDLVFKQPHLTPDREEVKEKKKRIIKSRKMRPLPTINSYDEFIGMLEKSEPNKTEKGGKKKKQTKKRKGKKKRKTLKRKKKRRTLKRKHTKR